MLYNLCLWSGQGASLFYDALGSRFEPRLIPPNIASFIGKLSFLWPKQFYLTLRRASQASLQPKPSKTGTKNIWVEAFLTPFHITFAENKVIVKRSLTSNIKVRLVSIKN